MYNGFIIVSQGGNAIVCAQFGQGSGHSQREAAGQPVRLPLWGVLCPAGHFIFLCRLDGTERKTPTEKDRFQAGCEWIDLRDAHYKNLFPRAIRDNLSGLIDHGSTIFIGSEKDR